MVHDAPHGNRLPASIAHTETVYEGTSATVSGKAAEVERAESSSAETIEGINTEPVTRSLCVPSVFTWPTDKARTTDTSDANTPNPAKDTANASGQSKKTRLIVPDLPTNGEFLDGV